jgi:hypothetical protein
MRYWGMTATEAGLWVIGTVLCIVCFALYWAALHTNSLALLHCMTYLPRHSQDFLSS